jgi:hypothetical protein
VCGYANGFRQTSSTVMGMGIKITTDWLSTNFMPVKGKGKVVNGLLSKKTPH